MISRPPPRKPDLFVVILMAVAIGVSTTVAYQVHIHYSGDELSIAGTARGGAVLPPIYGG